MRRSGKNLNPEFGCAWKAERLLLVAVLCLLNDPSHMICSFGRNATIILWLLGLGFEKDLGGRKGI